MDKKPRDSSDLNNISIMVVLGYWCPWNALDTACRERNSKWNNANSRNCTIRFDASNKEILHKLWRRNSKGCVLLSKMWAETTNHNSSIRKTEIIAGKHPIETLSEAFSGTSSISCLGHSALKGENLKNRFCRTGLSHIPRRRSHSLSRRACSKPSSGRWTNRHNIIIFGNATIS